MNTKEGSELEKKRRRRKKKGRRNADTADADAAADKRGMASSKEEFIDVDDVINVNSIAAEASIKKHDASNGAGDVSVKRKKARDKKSKVKDYVSGKNKPKKKKGQRHGSSGVEGFSGARLAAYGL